MKSKGLIIIFLFTLTLSSYAQNTFHKNYGNNLNAYGVNSIIRTSDNGFMISGGIYDSISQSNVIIVKLDSLKNVEWSKTFHSAPVESSNCVVQTEDDGFLILCNYYINSLNPYRIGLIKINSSGDTLWTKSYSASLSTLARSIIQTNDKGFLLTGDTYTNSPGFSPNMYVMKIDSLGNPLWNKIIGASLSYSMDAGMEAVEMNDGSLMILGRYHYDSGKVGYLLYRTDSIGNTLWVRNIATQYICLPTHIEKTNDGGLVIVGQVRDVVTTTYDIHFMKMDSLANVEWSYIYSSGVQDEVPQTVHQTSDGGYIIAGQTYQSLDGKPFLIKTNMLGDTLWTRRYSDGTANSSDIAAALEEPEGGYLLICHFAFSSNFSLIKTDTNGYSGCFDLSSQFTVTPTISQVLITFPDVSSTNTVNSYSPIVNSHSIQTTNHCPVNINETILQNFSVYPNPFTSEISITFQKSNISQAIFTIKNIVGQELWKSEENRFGNNSIKIIDLNFLPGGIYLLDIIIDGEHWVEKIIKE